LYKSQCSVGLTIEQSAKSLSLDPECAELIVRAFNALFNLEIRFYKIDRGTVAHKCGTSGSTGEP